MKPQRYGLQLVRKPQRDCPQPVVRPQRDGRQLVLKPQRDGLKPVPASHATLTVPIAIIRFFSASYDSFIVVHCSSV